MKSLSIKALAPSNLPQKSAQCSVFQYDRDKVKNGVVHFGIGNFHRCHQALYCDDLLAQGDMRWGITGVSLRSSKVRDALKPQSYLYTHVTLSDKKHFRIVGAVKNILVAPENPDEVIRTVASADTHLVTATVTEKAYSRIAEPNAVVDNAEKNVKDEYLSTELQSLSSPKTIFGFLAAAIIRRAGQSADEENTRLTVMCCDNIRSGGELLRKGVEFLLARHCTKSLEWSKSNVAFISSMVDRISPATFEPLRLQVSSSLEVDDAWPVSAEPFSQWVIQKPSFGCTSENVTNPMLPFSEVGALLVDDVVAYENMKLRLLNAGHSIVSALGYLNQNEYVHQAIKSEPIRSLVREILFENILPLVTIPPGFNGEAYIESVISRFENEALPYATQQVNTDSSQKIVQRWFPSFELAVNESQHVSRLAFLLAAWMVYVQNALANEVLNDPRAETLARLSADQEGFFEGCCEFLSEKQSFSFLQNKNFILEASRHYETIRHEGISDAIKGLSRVCSH